MRVPLVFLTYVLLVILSISPSHSQSVSAVTIPTRTFSDADCGGTATHGSIDDTTCNIANTTHHYRVACSLDGLTFNITYYDNNNNNENTSCTPTTFQPIQEIVYTNGTCINSTIKYDCPIPTTTNTTIAPNSTETPTATSTPTATEPPTTPTPTTPTPTTSPNNTGSTNSTSAPTATATPNATATPTTPSPDPLPPKYTGGYVGIFYNLSVKADLKQKFYSTNTLGTAAPNSSHLEQYDHVTIHFQPNQTHLNEYNPRFGQKQSVHVLGYAMDEHGQAILVSIDGPNAIQSTNSFPHVTISVSNSPGYSAVYSNDLWSRIAASGYINITYDSFNKPSILVWNTSIVNESAIINNTYQFTLPEFKGEFSGNGTYNSTVVKVTLYKPTIGGIQGIFCASKQWNQTSGGCDTTPIVVDPTATPSPSTASPTTTSPTTTSPTTTSNTTTSPNATTSPNTTASPTTSPTTSIPTAAIPTFQLSVRVYANADCSGDATSASTITNGVCDGSNAVNESHVITCSSDGLRATDQKYISVGTTKTCSPTQLASTRIWSAGICQQNPDTKQYFRIDCPITESYATSSYPDEKSNIGKVVGWSIGIVIGVCLLTSLLTYLFRDRLSGNGNGNGIPLKTDNAGNIIQMQVMEKNTAGVVP